MDGYVCLTDFGLVKEGVSWDERTNTYCGSPEYLAPEIILGMNEKRGGGGGKTNFLIKKTKQRQTLWQGSRLVGIGHLHLRDVVGVAALLRRKSEDHEQEDPLRAPDLRPQAFLARGDLAAKGIPGTKSGPAIGLWTRRDCRHQEASIFCRHRLGEALRAPDRAAFQASPEEHPRHQVLQRGIHGRVRQGVLRREPPQQDLSGCIPGILMGGPNGAGQVQPHHPRHAKEQKNSYWQRQRPLLAQIRSEVGGLHGRMESAQLRLRYPQQCLSQLQGERHPAFTALESLHPRLKKKRITHPNHRHNPCIVCGFFPSSCL